MQQSSAGLFLQEVTFSNEKSPLGALNE